MTATIIDGKAIAAKVRAELAKKVGGMDVAPGLAIVLVGNNPASEIYVNFKEKACKSVGIYCERFNLPETVSQDELLRIINELNNNAKIHGMIVQLPLPNHINETLVIDAILPHKDADGFTPVNTGNLFNGNNLLLPATAKASVELIQSTNIPLEGKHAVIVGRSSIVGKPTALLLLQKNMTVTICHSRTKELASFTKKADVLVAAVGKANLITKEMVKAGAIVIDVGINRTPAGLVGDVDYESVKEVAGFITPVPGGVGPMTIAMLLQNTVQAAEFGKDFLRG